MFKRYMLIGPLVLLATLTASAREILVGDDPANNITDLNNALENAVSGDIIILKPGTYQLNSEIDSLFYSELEGVTVRGEDPSDLPVIDGDGIGRVFLLRRPVNVTLQDLIIQNMTEGGLNIDDADVDTGDPPGDAWLPTLAHDVTLRNIIIRDIGVDGGNIDGLKLSGLNDFLIDNVQVINWGDGGSAIDMVGCHNGEIKDSLFRSDRENVLTTGLVTKGGSENITIKNNRFELPQGSGAAVKLGGSTGEGLFRFKAGDSGYEAKDISVDGNTVINGRSAFSYVNIDGGLVQNNIIYKPKDWIIRILNEAASEGNNFPTRNGKFLDNTIIFDNGLQEAVNIDDNNPTEPETFQFAHNQWYNDDDPSASFLQLPVEETDPSYGVDPGFDPNVSAPDPGGDPGTGPDPDPGNNPGNSETGSSSGGGGGALSIPLLLFLLMRRTFRTRPLVQRQ